MEEFTFTALGTHWSIVTDDRALKREEQKALVGYVSDFEKRFSRFLPTSEVNQFRDAKSGEYQISEEFSVLLSVADTLRTLTAGVYDPAVGALLEQSGYNREYRLTVDQEGIDSYHLSAWSLQGTTLSVEGPIAFDLGGIGKGRCIDLVADFLKNLGYQYFLVEAGGDMYATNKANGSPFQIALEWPGKPGVAFGTLELSGAGFAASDSFRRRWKDWHHIVDPHTKKPIQKIIGCTAVAKTAFAADCMTSGLFLAPPESYEKIAKKYMGEYVVFGENEQVVVSTHWAGEFFK